MFRDRQCAGELLADKLRSRLLHDPLVLAIPCGGVLVGAVMARILHAELDVVLSRKLRSPHQADKALVALAENGAVYLDPSVHKWPEGVKDFLEVEKRFQADWIAQEKKLFRSVRPQSSIAGRSVVVTDDGLATGSTMLAALPVIHDQHPRELIVAVPVCSRDRVAEIRRCCDDLVYLLCVEGFLAVGRSYEDFHQVTDHEVRDLLQQFAPVDRREPIGKT